MIDNFVSFNKEAPKYRVIKYLIAFIFIVFCSLKIFACIKINGTSLIYSKYLLGISDEFFPTLEDVEDHNHAILWMIDHSLNQGETSRAIEYWDQQNNKDNALAAHYYGKILYQEKEIIDAVETWMNIGDINALQKIVEQAGIDGDEVTARLATKTLYDFAPESFGFDYVRLLMKNKGFEEARVVVLDILLLDISDSEKAIGYVFLGDIYRQEKAWFDAQKAYQEAILFGPNNSKALIGLAWAKYELGGELKSALSIFDRVEELEPESGVGSYNQGLLYAREGDYPQAIEMLNQAVRKDPGNLWWHLVRARSAFDADDYPLAIEYYEGTIENFPNDARAYHEISYVYQLEGNTKQAVDAIENALDLVNEPSYWYFIRAGSIYEDVGNIPQALWAFEQALSLNPESETAKNRIEKLK